MYSNNLKKTVYSDFSYRRPGCSMQNEQGQVAEVTMATAMIYSGERIR